MKSHAPGRRDGSIFTNPAPALALAALSLVAACAPESAGPGTGGVTGGGSGGAPGSGGRSGSGGGGSSGSGTGGVIGSGGAEPTGTGGSASGGSGSGGAGTGGAASGGSGTGGSGSGGSGTGGAGTAGAGTGGAGTGGTAGGATGGSSTGGGGAGPLSCPANATFCAGFEENSLPAKAVYMANAAPGDWTRDFAYDATKSHVGRGSLRVKSSTEAGTSGSAYKMLSVPAPPTSFWVRFFIWSDVDLGAVDHNPFAMASGSDSPNDSGNLEFADDAGIAFNFHDDVRWPEGYSRTNRFTLPKGVWHCIEVYYDSGPARNQQLFINGMQRINITGWPTTTQLTTTFKVFKFGFNELHGPPRATWYDDVVVAPQRIPCQ